MSPSAVTCALQWLKANAIALVALIVGIAGFGLSLYRELQRPELRYSIRELDKYPGTDGGFSVAVDRAEVGSLVTLRHGMTVTVRSTGRSTASDVELRVTSKDGSVIVQVHPDNEALVEKLPDLGRQGSPEVAVAIRRMVPGEKVALTFWYGYPGSGDKKPPRPAVLLRHTAALGRLESE
jgi:hypothetical protein